VRPDTPLAEAARIMLERKIGCLPVVEAGKLVGILTESDFVRLGLKG
jgi:CBS domain-containing membrane protein